MNILLKLIWLIVFLFVITPIGLLLRLFGIDLLDKKIDSNNASYWKQPR